MQNPFSDHPFHARPIIRIDTRLNPYDEIEHRPEDEPIVALTPVNSLLDARQAAADLDAEIERRTSAARSQDWTTCSILASDLTIDPRIQLGTRLDRKRVEAIAAEWNWGRYRPIVVGLYDGNNNVIDGWHRLEAAKLRFAPDDVELECYVGACTLQEAGLLFAYADKHRRALTAEQKIHALATADVPEAIEFLECVKGFGFKLNSARTARGYLRAVGGAWSIWMQRGGQLRLKRILRIIVESWNYDSDSVERSLLTGLNLLLKDHDVDDGHLIERLRGYHPREVFGVMAGGYRASTKNITPSTAVMYALIDVNNKGLSSRSRLRIVPKTFVS